MTTIKHEITTVDIKEEQIIRWERRLKMIQTVMDNSHTIAVVRNNIHSHHYTPKEKIEQIQQTIPLLNEAKILVQCLDTYRMYEMVKYLAFEIFNITQQLRHSSMTKRDKDKLQNCVDELLVFKDW